MSIIILKNPHNQPAPTNQIRIGLAADQSKSGTS